MSAHTIFDNAPIGSIVAWSDGTPQPSARFREKLAAWQSGNSRGRLIRKQGGRGAGNVSLSACFTLHEVDYGAGGVIGIRIHRTFSLESKLHFTVVERPALGSVRVLVVAITFPHLFTAFERRWAERTIKDSWPDAWETIFGAILKPGESYEKDRRAFEQAHARDWIVVSAITSKHAPGFLETVATPGQARAGD
jgi:uncharacterized protein DUF7007